MQTVNFQCGHCGKLMAVGVEFLGQQVRCPHCQQVVLAPAANVPAPATAPDPSPVPAPPEDPFRTLSVTTPTPADDPFRALTVPQQEDIFTTRNEPEDALFGQSDAPHLEIPRDSVPSSPAPAFDMPMEPFVASPPPAPEPEPTFPMVSPSPSASESTEAPYSRAPELETMPWSPPGVPSEAPSAPFDGAPADVGALATPSVRKPHDESGRVNWFIPLVFIPLVLYAVLATAAAGFVYLRVQTRPPSIWEQFPDVEGDNQGIRFKTKGGANLRFNREDAVKPLPNHLKVNLGETLTLGDLEVTPTKVRRQRVKVFVEGFETPEACEYDSLVLTLEFRNLSREYAFTPLDNYFDRHWNGKDTSSVPLTALVAGKQRFFGGPARWYPMKRDQKKGDLREYVDLPGRKNSDPVGLGPGETTEACICTDGGRPGDAPPAVASYLFGAGKGGRATYSGDLTWRVQVRRGLIEYKGKRMPADSVIGVEFSSKDYAN
jgi:hypothetical protein